MQKWEVLNSEKIVDNKWITIERQKCDIGHDKIIEDYYTIKKRDYVIIIAEIDNEIYFVKQYRHGIGEIILNLPMGLIDKNETAETAAKRELYEETCLEADQLEYLGNFFLAPSYISTRAHIFYVNNARKREKEKSDTNEEVLITTISKAEIKRLIESNNIKDMSTVIALYRANNKLNLF